MNTRSRQEFQKSTKNSNNNMPSFSSTLLDEIYRSIDGNAEEKTTTVDLKKPSKRHGETSSFRRACLVEKWIEKEKDTKRKPTTLMQEFDNDVMFFSSTSSSSDSSGGLSSSSDNEFFGSVTKASSSSCFSARLKPLRTGPSSDEEKKKKKKMETSFINSLYANLKHPISPGGRLTSFINSLFSNAAAANPKKSKNLLQDLNSHKAAAAASASSFSRSCLSNTRDKMRRDGSQRSVVSTVILDHQKSNTYDDEQPHKLQIRPTELKQSNRVVDEVLKGYNGKRVDELLGIRKIHDDEDDEDCMSDSSSDLFELDHLSLFGDNRFCEELPVYETTHFHTNPPPTAFIR